MVEYTDAPSPDHVRVSRRALPGQHAAREDDDFAACAVLAGSGAPGRRREVAAFSAAGCERVDVSELGVAIISTGDEVVPPDTARLRPGQVRDAIGPAIAALVRVAHAEPVRHGIVPDNEVALSPHAARRSSTATPRLRRQLGRRA